MQIFISNQQTNISKFGAWLLRKLDIQYELEAPEEESEAEGVTPQVEETPKSNEPQVTSVTMSEVSRELSTRANNVITVLLHNHKIRLKDITVEDFAKKFSALDLMKIQGCGKVTVGEITKVLGEYGYKLREENTVQR